MFPAEVHGGKEESAKSLAEIHDEGVPCRCLVDGGSVSLGLEFDPASTRRTGRERATQIESIESDESRDSATFCRAAMLRLSSCSKLFVFNGHCSIARCKGWCVGAARSDS